MAGLVRACSHPLPPSPHSHFPPLAPPSPRTPTAPPLKQKHRQYERQLGELREQLAAAQQAAQQAVRQAGSAEQRGGAEPQAAQPAAEDQHLGQPVVMVSLSTVGNHRSLQWSCRAFHACWSARWLQAGENKAAFSDAAGQAQRRGFSLRRRVEYIHSIQTPGKHVLGCSLLRAACSRAGLVPGGHQAPAARGGGG